MTLDIAIPIFDGITALDAIGPDEVLSRLPGAQVHFLAHEPGAKRTDNRMLALTADGALSEVPHPDVIVFPGGHGTRTLMHDEAVLTWVRAAHESSQWTTSVCTGALVLGAAGILDGLEATTHIAGEGVAQAIQLGIEYDPQPPFDSGSTSKAPAAIVELARARA
jgi:putative intracellular protease/amidase